MCFAPDTPHPVIDKQGFLNKNSISITIYVLELCGGSVWRTTLPAIADTNVLRTLKRRRALPEMDGLALKPARSKRESIKAVATTLKSGSSGFFFVLFFA